MARELQSEGGRKEGDQQGRHQTPDAGADQEVWEERHGLPLEEADPVAPEEQVLYARPLVLPSRAVLANLRDGGGEEATKRCKYYVPCLTSSSERWSSRLKALLQALANSDISTDMLSISVLSGSGAVIAATCDDSRTSSLTRALARRRRYSKPTSVVPAELNADFGRSSASRSGPHL